LASTLYSLARPLLFRLDAERAHELVTLLGRFAQRVPPLLRALETPPDPRLAHERWGLEFRSPVGLAAGMDKGGRLLPLWQALGFGFVEVGTVTPRPQPGNPRPRLFRDPATGLVLNRMGFNSEGAAVVAKRLARRPAGLVVGGNIGKNRDTSEEDAAQDYRAAYEVIGPLVDYVVVNVSSPNTAGLRDLQAPKALLEILETVASARERLGLTAQPFLVKIAPDLADDALVATVEASLAGGAAGIVATNTTTDRAIVPLEVAAKAAGWGDGGLSGAPLHAKAAAVQQRVLDVLRGRADLVACGGIRSATEARQALVGGAALVQLYSGLVFGGPQLVGRMNAELVVNEDNALPELPKNTWK
jgi:dihydroorotate dehydrogenase